MDAIPLELQNRLPRPIRRRRKKGGYNAWAMVYLTLQLSATSIVCCVIGWLFINWGLVLLFFGILLFPFAFLSAICSLIEIFRHRYLVKYGVAVIGEVILSEEHNYENDFGGYHTVAYKFVTDDGVEMQSEWSHAEQPFWNSKCGDKFIMIYKRNQPSTHIAYDSALFEAR